MNGQKKGEYRPIFFLSEHSQLGTLVWVKELRIWVLLAGLLLHLGIEVSMSIGFFEWVMIAAYILFLEPKEVFWLKDRLKLLIPRKLQSA